MPSLLVDDSRFPLVRVMFDGVVPEPVFDEYIQKLDSVLKRAVRERARVAWVFDARKAGMAPPTHRRKQADWIRDNFEGARATCAGFAFVLDSAMVRGVITAVLWFAPMPAPHTLVGTVVEAERWCAERLNEHGVTLRAETHR